MLHLDDQTRMSVAGILRTATDVDGGRTPEQERFVAALTEHVLRVAPSDIPVVTVSDVSSVVTGKPRLRKGVAELLVTLEFMRHPASAPLTHRVGEYITALEVEDGFQQLARDYLAGDRELIGRDWERTREPDLQESFIEGKSNAEIGATMLALQDLPADSVGHALFEFYRRNGFPYIPDDEPDQDSLIPHDMTHVIAGYGTTAEAELALQAFLVGSARGERHFSSLAASILLFEIGMVPFPGIEATDSVLARPGAAEFMAKAIERGLRCDGDVAGDHSAFLDQPLAEVRRKLGIPEPEPGPHMFIL